MIRSGLALCLAGLSCGLLPVSCDRTPATPASQAKPAAPAAVPNATPAPPGLAELDAVFRLFPQDKVLLTAYMKPGTPGLVLVDPPEPDSADQLIKWLESIQTHIPRMLELSRKPLEQFPAVDPPQASSEISAAPRFQVKWISMVLEADAARLADKGELDAAIVRAAAILRFCDTLRKQGISTESAGRAAIISRRLTAIAETKPDAWTAVSAASAADLQSAFASAGESISSDIIAKWEPSARSSLKFCRETLSGPGGPAAYALYLRDYGVPAEVAASMDSLAAKPGWPKLSDCTPHQDLAEAAAKLTPADITKALDDAEKLILTLAEALRNEDQAAIVETMKIVSAEPTHLARVVLGDAGSAIPFVLAMREATDPAKAKIDLLPR